MRFDELLTDAAVLGELGERLKRHRVGRNLTQAELAEQAGVGRSTVQRVEEGQSVQMTSFVKLLRALGLLGGLDATIPERIVLPIAEVDRTRRERHRVRRGSSDQPDRREGQWTWDDEPEGHGG